MGEEAIAESIEDTIVVIEGWNLIGSISDPISVSSISSIPSGIITSQFFSYGGSYISADSIKPGKGYWVKVVESGQLILSSEPTGSMASRIKIVPTSELPPSPPLENGEVKEIPSEYTLKQNYPNPFNPSTSIKYGLPEAVHVRLSVFNILGQCVMTLVDERKNAGFYEVTIDASKLTSGIYFYRLQTGNFTSVQKMLLVK